MEGSTADAQAAGSGLPGSMVPWNQIPRFTPGETDVRTYSKKLQFSRELWPAEYLDQLAPRAAMAVEGVAFQKVSRLDPGRLKSKDGVKYLVEALGGEWGRLPSEEKFDLFEKALYMTSQKSDESNDSYLARHDAAFEELMSQKVQLEDVRAYVLLRQSVLGAEDRKKIILDCAGNLSYDLARKSIRLLGSKFFQDLQTQGKTQGRTKTYDVNHVDEEPIYYQEEEEMDEDVLMQQLLESGDDDAMWPKSDSETSAADSETPRPSDSETCRPPDSETSASDSETSRPSDSETRCSPDSETSRPSDSETARPSDSETSRPSDSETCRPSDWETSASDD